MGLIQKMREKLADIAIEHSASKGRRQKEKEKKLATKESMQGLYKLCTMATCFGIVGVRMECTENEIRFWDAFSDQRAKFDFTKLEDVEQNMKAMTDFLYDTFVNRQGYLSLPRYVCDADLYLKMINHFYQQYRMDKVYHNIMAGENGVFNISGKTQIVRHDVDYPYQWTMAEAYQQAGTLFSKALDNDMTKISKKDYTAWIDKLHKRNKAIFEKYHGYESPIL